MGVVKCWWEQFVQLVDFFENFDGIFQNFLWLEFQSWELEALLLLVEWW